MSRYRKTDVRMWHADEKFRALSAAPPNGQTLWIYLLTGPETTNIPGLFSAGEAALAEALGWPLEGFREAFGEVFGKGMAKADWKARVVWVPNAIKYNEPESPNVVIGWKHTLTEIPECELKNQALQRLYTYLQGKGKAFDEAFLEAFGKAYGESGTGTGTGAGTGKRIPPSGGFASSASAMGGFEIVREHIKETYKKKKGATIPMSKMDLNTIRNLISDYSAAQLRALWDMFMEKNWDWKDKSGRVTKKIPHDVKNFRENLTILLEDQSWKTRMLPYEGPLDPENTGKIKELLANLQTGSKA